MTRADGRKFNQLRDVTITPDFNKFAEGSVLIRCGDTVVLCTASVEERVPPHVRPGCGWVTAEYSMLPRANRQRSRRDVDKLKLSSRSAEIQRLIGRSLRAAVDMKLLGERTITIDCDVLQGDGGTRTASVTGGFVALAQVDLNCIMNELGEIIEIQGTGEGRAFTVAEQQELVTLCAKGNRELIAKQKEIVGDMLR